METTVTATEARVRFGEMMRRVTEEHNTIIVARGGEPTMVMLSIDEYERLQTAVQNQEHWLDRVRQTRAQLAAKLGDREIPPSEEIIRQMREDRDAQLAHLS